MGHCVRSALTLGNLSPLGLQARIPGFSGEGARLIMNLTPGEENSQSLLIHCHSQLMILMQGNVSYS